LFFLGLCLEGMRKVIMTAGLWVKLKLEKHETSYMWCGVGCSPVTVRNVSQVLSPDLYRLIISPNNCHWSSSSCNTRKTELWCTMSNVFARWRVSVSRRNIFPTPSLHNVSKKIILIAMCGPKLTANQKISSCCTDCHHAKLSELRTGVSCKIKQPLHILKTYTMKTDLHAQFLKVLSNLYM